jgi:hypothetical protein
LVLFLLIFCLAQLALQATMLEEEVEGSFRTLLTFWNKTLTVMDSPVAEAAV